MKPLGQVREQQYATWYGGGSAPARGHRSDAAVVAGRIARSMLGRAVTIRLDSGDTIHGIVTNVLAVGRKPKVIVGGLEYPLANVLTAAPPEMVAGSSENTRGAFWTDRAVPS